MNWVLFVTVYVDIEIAQIDQRELQLGVYVDFLSYLNIDMIRLKQLPVPCKNIKNAYFLG